MRACAKPHGALCGALPCGANAPACSAKHGTPCLPPALNAARFHHSTTTCYLFPSGPAPPAPPPQFDFNDDVWSVVSGDAKDVIKRLLVVDPAKRMTLQEVGHCAACLGPPRICCFGLVLAPWRSANGVRPLSGTELAVLPCIAPPVSQVFEHPWCKSAADDKRELLKVGCGWSWLEGLEGRLEAQSRGVDQQLCAWKEASTILEPLASLSPPSLISPHNSCRLPPMLPRP